MKYLAPAGTVMSLREIASGVSAGLLSGQVAKTLASQISARSALPHCWPVASGRAAMTLILESMRQVAADTGRDEVIIPAYTCYSVGASIERAGLRPRLCDVDPDTLGIDPDALERCDFSRVLAVVSANLYGIPNALDAIERSARQRGVFMLDDAAQALGATLAGRAVGAFGDAGLYSFDKGKIICTIQGGAIVARDGELAVALAERVSALQISAAGETVSNAIKLPIYALCLRPTIYGMVRRLPFLGLGRTVYETRYPLSGLSDMQAGVASRLMGRLDELNGQRRSNARALLDALTNQPNIILPRMLPGAEAVYARLPIRVPNPELRERFLAALDDAGIGASTSYPSSLADVPEIAARLRSPDLPMPGARRVAAEIVTLPTHGYCPPNIGVRVREILTQCERESGHA